LTNTLVPRTLFSLGCTHGTWVADGTHRTSTYSQLTF